MNLSFFELSIWASAFIAQYLLEYSDLQNFIGLLHLFFDALLNYIVKIYSGFDPESAKAINFIQNWWFLATKSTETP